MSAITRDDVAHLARLARIAMTDEELDRLAGELDVILGAVAPVQKGTPPGHPPPPHSVPPADRPRRGRAGTVPRRRSRTGRCTGGRGRPVPRPTNPRGC